ncbi:MAG: EamA family transporter [Anaerolineales bacterium]|nr:EamA family transporter [Anaerolineales bacterium]
MPNALLYLITVLIWGSTWLAIKFQLGIVPPALSIVYRFTLAAGLLWLYTTLRRLPMRFSRQQHAFMALQGFFLFSLNYILVYLAEGYLTSGLVAIVFSSIVIANVIFSAILLKDPIRLRVIAGGLMGLVGLVLIFGSELRSFNLSNGRALGLTLAICAMLCASLGNIVAARNQRSGLPVLQSNTLGMTYGTGFTLLLVLFQGTKLTFDPSAPYIISLIFLALFGSVIAFGTYLTLLGRIGPDRAAYVTILFQIVALALSTIFEELTWNLQGIFGVILILAGNVIALSKISTGTKQG